MSEQPRVARVLAALLVSMTTGAVILMALGNNAPSAGPFCLASYYRLDSVEMVISSEATQSIDRWNSIEIYYSGTKAGNIEQLAATSGLANSQDINCHFVICNGLGGDDGQILTTEKWQRQWSVIPGRAWYGSDKTIRICIIADGETAVPTDFQVKKTEELVQGLYRRFDVAGDSIFYPSDWQ